MFGGIKIYPYLCKKFEKSPKQKYKFNSNKMKKNEKILLTAGQRARAERNEAIVREYARLTKEYPTASKSKRCDHIAQNLPAANGLCGQAIYKIISASNY